MLNIINKLAKSIIDQTDITNKAISKKEQPVTSNNNSTPAPFQPNILNNGALLKQKLFNSLPSSVMTFSSQESAPISSSPVILTSEQEYNLAFENAPIFYLHPNEDYEPGDPTLAIEGNDPTTFSDNATSGDRHVTVQGTPGTDENGQLVVYDQNGEVMKDDAGKPLIHATQIPEDEFIKIQEKAPGDAETAPIIYDYNAGPPPTMTYWVFSPYNNGYNNHQGDWEGVTIEFSTNPDGTLGEPVSVTYSSHGTPVTLPWDLVPKENGRPVVYVGEGSHAMSPFTANRPTEAGFLDDHFGKGKRIDSQTRLRRIEDEPWYQYGGVKAHWGQRGTKGADWIPNQIPGAEDLENMNDGVQGPTPTSKTKIEDKRTPAEKEADAMIMKHAERDENGNLVLNEDGEPIINYETLGAEAAELARADPEGSAALITAVNDRTQKLFGEGDEFAQEFVDALCPDDSEVSGSDLETYAETEAGSGVLLSIQNSLGQNSVHSDEVEDIYKINEAFYLAGK